MNDNYTKLYRQFEASGGVDHSTFALWMVEELTKTTTQLALAEAVCEASGDKDWPISFDKAYDAWFNNNKREMK